MANQLQNIKLVVLYDDYINKKWDIYLPEEKISNRPHVNVLNDDTALYDSLTDNHKSVAMVAILSRYHLDKLTDENTPKIARNFLNKIAKAQKRRE